MSRKMLKKSSPKSSKPAAAPRSRKPATPSFPTASELRAMQESEENPGGDDAETETEPTTVTDTEPSNNVVDDAATMAVESNPTATEVAPKAQETNTIMTTLTLVRIRKNGSATYAIAGVSGTVRLAKAMFVGEPPQTIEVASEGLAQPNPEKAAKLAAKAERKAKLETSRAERAQKAAERIAKQEARLAKQRVRLAKLNASLNPASQETAAQ